MRDAWRQFHGSGPNMGWKLRSTARATRPAWRLDIGDVAASPVVDSEGVIYLGSAEGDLMAVNADGTERWRRTYGHPIIAAPAVAEDGCIYFIISLQTGLRPDGDHEEGDYLYRSILMKANPDGGFLWSFELPGEGFTNSAPKLWNRSDGAHVFVYFTRSTPGGPAGELCVLDPEGRIRARSGTLGCAWPISGTPGFIKIIWEGIKDFPFYEFDTSGLRRFPLYLEPTVAITDASNLVEDGTVLVAVADNLCRLAAYQYDGSRLEQVWEKLHDLERKHSSPVIAPAGEMIVGDETGKVSAFDVLSGRELWAYDAEEPVLAVPASFGMSTFVVSAGHIHQVNTANGHRIDRHAFAADSRRTLSSPAVSMDWIHIAHDRGLVSYKLGDLNYRAHDQDYKLGALSPSPAIGAEGELYVVHDSEQLWAYA